ncbi:MAG TPA: hypothetical protein VNI61_04420 [Gemmatimonadales bacterium]|nr:hypothetical protein [Gemmatimonadales bacterium]
MTIPRSGPFLVAAALALGCTRTVVVTPPPEPDDRRGPSTAVTLGIPPGHLPRPGQCRIWIPGTPPGRQPYARSRPCPGISRVAPAGSWIVYRPTRDRRLVHVRVVDPRRVGVIVIVRVFEAESGRFVREARPEDEPWDEDRPDQDRPRERPRDERPPPADRPQIEPPREERPLDQRPREERPQPDRPPSERPPSERPEPKTAPPLDIPPGHLPEPGECRIWIPGTPPGRQPGSKSRDCAGLAREAPPGSWVVYRPTDDRTVVEVRVVDARRPGVVVAVRIFEVETGRFLRERQP